MSDDPIKAMVERYPAEAISEIFKEENKINFEKAGDEFNSSDVFIRSWVANNKIPAQVKDKLEQLWKAHIQKIIEHHKQGITG